ncbi:endonuclease/exonuclease/phosphatase family protein [Rhodococcus gannanensis]|uniref:Endonuclease/exonuclease/phosphatase family protein n=1 Tax=Rhodococcus gannanensis TaxID=1960308 RepID=A0ABW4PC06_9NOCA
MSTAPDEVSPSRSRGRRARRVAVAIGWAALAGAVVGVTAHLMTVTSPLVVVAASAAPYLLFGSVVAVLVFLAVRHWAGLAVATAVAVAAAWTQAPLYLGGGAAAGDELVVMQANIEFGKGDPDSVVAQVRSRYVDILAVEELTDSALAGLDDAGLGDLLPYRYVRPAASGADGSGMWSRYPLTDRVEYPDFVMAALSARVVLPGDRSLTMFVAHPLPPWPRHQTPIWADELSRLHTILDGLRSRNDMVLMAADFNATWDHAQFRALLGDGVHDAAEQAGAGVLRTYPTDRSLPPLLSIDRILVSGATATEVDAVDLPGADHRGVVARIAIPDWSAR